MANNTSGGTSIKTALLSVGGILAAVGTACQLAGITTVLLANVVLFFGVAIFTTAEVWFSEWIQKVGPYKGAITSVVFCASGCCTILISHWIVVTKASQAAPTGVSFMQMDAVVFRRDHAKIEAGRDLQMNAFSRSMVLSRCTVSTTKAQYSSFRTLLRVQTSRQNRSSKN